jgi:hypothetical protein
MTLSELLHAEVVDASGRRLGHVHDVHVVPDGEPAGPGQAPPYRVESLAVGPRGLLIRLGLRSAHDDVPWAAVTAIEPGRVRVGPRR